MKNFQKLNDLGHYGSMTHVWQTLPEGGHPGDFLHIGTTEYWWDPAQGNWRADVYPNTDGYRLLHQEGDVAVTNDLRVGGRLSVTQNARYQRDVTIEGTLIYSHLRGMDCGLYANVARLHEAWPSPRRGQWALVGETPGNMALYACDICGTWSLLSQGQTLADAFSLDAYDAARQVVDDIVASGYIFCGVATTDTVNPHQPADHNVFYLSSGAGTYVNFGALQVRRLSALLWDCHADPDCDGVAEGQWRAQAILDGVFVFAENIAPGALTLDKAPEIQQYVDALIETERTERQSGQASLEANLQMMGSRMVRSLRVNDGERIWPDSEGTVSLEVPATTTTVVNPIDEETLRQVESNTTDIATIKGQINRLIAAINEDMPLPDVSADAMLYPEYYGAKGDGLPFYEWPLRCFNGSVSGVTAENFVVKNDEVFAPSERIWNDGGYNFPYTTANVYYDTERRKFLLRAGGIYYENWANSGEWNDPVTGLARTDCVFSDIYVENQETQAGRRVSYVVRDGVLTDITTLMTDDTEAIYACARANGGSLRLRDKIYFINSWGTQTSPWVDASGFVIDGGGGTLFVRPLHNHRPPVAVGSSGTSSNVHLFSFKGASNGVIRNLRIRSIRDRDNGSPAGMSRFSCSDSRLNAFVLSNSTTSAPHHLRFENIDLDGMHEDFDCDSSTLHDIVVEGWKSRRFCQNALRGGPWTIRHADLEQHPWIGGGLHVIYGQTRLHDVLIEDSHLRQGGPFVAVMLDFSATANNQEYIPKNIRFRRCALEGGQIILGSGYSNTGTQDIHLEECRIRQLWKEFMGSSSKGILNYAINANTMSLFIENSTIWTKTGVNALSFYANSSAPLRRVSLVNSSFFCEEQYGGGGNLFNLTPANLVTHWVTTNYRNRGGRDNMDNALDHESIAEVTNGLRGERARIPILVGSAAENENGLPVNGMLTIPFSAEESITLSVDTMVHTRSEMVQYLGSLLDECGYAGLWSQQGANNEYLVVVSKKKRKTTLSSNGTLAAAGALGEGSPAIYTRPGTGDWAYLAGSDPKWEMIGASGTTMRRPTDAKVGCSFFDTTLGKPVWVKNRQEIRDAVTNTVTEITLTWVDATGNEV